MQVDREMSGKLWRSQAVLSSDSDLSLEFVTYTISRLNSRVVKTLSRFFLEAVLERALFQTSQQFDFLASVEVKESTYDFVPHKNFLKSLTPSRRHLAGLALVETYLGLISTLTGGVLSQVLYDELASITFAEVKTNLSGKEDDNG